MLNSAYFCGVMPGALFLKKKIVYATISKASISFVKAK